jgi:hypothetical protein
MSSKRELRHVHFVFIHEKWLRSCLKHRETAWFGLLPKKMHEESVPVSLLET